MKKSGGDRLKCVVYESTRAPLRGPPSPMGKAAKREHRFSRIVRTNTRIWRKRITTDKAFPNGEGSETRISVFSTQRLSQWRSQRGGGFATKRKPTPPRCARQPLPREGASVDTPSFLWKEVPRRGGGWMGIAVSPTQSLPRVGKVASGASRIGY